MGKRASYFLFALVLCFLLFATFWLKRNSFHSGPFLSIDNMSYDAGIVHEAALVKHVFKLKNIGTKPLRILDAKTTCSCAVTTAPAQMILPGETGDLPVEVKVGSIGRKTEKILVSSNGENSPHILSVSATYKPPAFASSESQKIDFGRVCIDACEERRFKVFVFTKLPQDIRIDSLKTNSDEVQVVLLGSSMAEYRTTAGYLRKEFELNLKVPTHFAGRYEDVLTVTFDTVEKFKLSIPLFWEVSNRWEIIPSMILFICDGSPVGPNIKKVIVNDLEGKHAGLLRVKNPDEDVFNIDINHVDKSTELIVELKQTGNISGSDFCVELILKTQDGDEELVKIPIKLISMMDS